MTIKKIIGINILVIIIGFFAFAVGSYLLKQHQIQLDAIKREQLYNLILDGASVKPEDVTIDFSKQTSTGSPLIFGGAHSPDSTQQDAWNKIQNVGVTMVRIDLNLEWIIRNTTLENYKNNVNNIQDVNNWDKPFMDELKGKLTAAKKRGIKTMVILDYTPPWLAYNGTDFGVPKDWGVYKDIIKKIYRYYRNDIDYVEIWNEPSLGPFLVVKYSPYTVQEAYKMIFKTGVEAIKEVDNSINDGKTVLIGGPAEYSPFETSTLEIILQDSELRKYLNFVSYHNYDAQSLLVPSDKFFKLILKKYHMENTPIFITEWNYHSDGKIASPYITTNLGLIYTANELINFFKMGIAGANYYSLDNIQNSKNQNTGLSLNDFGFYHIVNNTAELMPLAKSWRILSRDMGLGKGISNIYLQHENINELNILGFRNSLEQEGVVILNASSSAEAVNLQFAHISQKNSVKLAVYFASEGNDAKIPVYEGSINAPNNTFTFPFSIPKDTVMGIIFGQEKEWFNITNLFNKKI